MPKYGHVVSPLLYRPSPLPPLPEGEGECTVRKWDLNHFRTEMIELPGHFAAKPLNRQYRIVVPDVSEHSLNTATQASPHWGEARGALSALRPTSPSTLPQLPLAQGKGERSGNGAPTIPAALRSSYLAPGTKRKRAITSSNARSVKKAVGGANKKPRDCGVLCS